MTEVIPGSAADYGSAGCGKLYGRWVSGGYSFGLMECACLLFV